MKEFEPHGTDGISDWRRSSHQLEPGGIELARLPEDSQLSSLGDIALRKAGDPEQPTVFATRAEMADFFATIRDGAFDGVLREAAIQGIQWDYEPEDDGPALTRIEPGTIDQYVDEQALAAYESRGVSKDDVTILLRGPDGKEVLGYTKQELSSFLDGVKHNEFDFLIQDTAAGTDEHARD